MNKKGLSIAIILAVIAILGIIAMFIGYKIHVNNKITQSIQELAQTTINDLKEKHPNGEFPEEMKDFLSTSTENLFDYCVSHPSDFRNKEKMIRHYERVLLCKKTDLYKYKKELLPKIKKLVGKYTKPDCFENNAKPTQKNTLPYSPDLKQFQNTLIEWCLIANCFEEKDDGNSAFLLSYAAARLSIKLLTDYADGASEENLKTVNNILRCASCQLIYIANSGLRHNRNMVRAMAKDLYTISEDFAPFSRTINYDLDLFDTIIKKLSNQGNYAISSTASNPSGEKQLLNQLRSLFRPLYEFCDLSYSECGSKIVSWDKDLREKAQKAVNDLDKGNMPKLISYAFINSFLPDYNELKLFTDETRSIIDGTATVLATYEFIDNQTGSFKYSPSLIAKYVGSSPPDSRLSGFPINIYLPGSNIISSEDKEVISYKNSETIIKMNKYNNIRSETIKNNFGITFLTKNEFILKNLRQEYKSDYPDLDKILSKIPPEQRADYEKNLLQEQEQEQPEKADEEDKLLKEIREKRVKKDSIDDILCGYKFGEIPKNVKESSYSRSDPNKLTFSVEIKKPFLGLFKLAEVYVGNNKKVRSIQYHKCCNTTSERETVFNRLKATIETMEGIKFEKHNEDNQQECYEYYREKDDCSISLSLIKGLDGGGTISLGASSVNAIIDSIKRE